MVTFPFRRVFPDNYGVTVRQFIRRRGVGIPEGGWIGDHMKHNMHGPIAERNTVVYLGNWSEFFRAHGCSLHTYLGG